VKEPGVDATLTEIIQAVRELIRGRTNAHGTVTLAASATTTTISDKSASNITASSAIALTPTTANAAAALTTTYVTAGKKQFVVTHANNAQLDRTFTWSAKG
jgi:hypothetical protein